MKDQSGILKTSGLEGIYGSEAGGTLSGVSEARGQEETGQGGDKGL